MNLKINTPLGKYTYRFVPLFAGTKVIDKQISARNLLDFKRILDDAGITFLLSYGTLLGAVREGDFISHDEDIDLIVSCEQTPSLLSSLFVLRDNGFEVCRYDRRGVISFMKEGEYIDIYIFSPLEKGILACGREVMPEQFLTDVTTFSFKGTSYNVPKEYIRYLEFFYGVDWQIPRQYYHYELPAWRRLLHIAVQYAKEFMPDWLFFALVEHNDRKYRQPLLDKIYKNYTQS